jgi:hypothetical protein
MSTTRPRKFVSAAISTVVVWSVALSKRMATGCSSGPRVKETVLSPALRAAIVSV